MEALNHLQSFVLSAEAGSFSAAARRLGLTPAAVSKNVARLEASLGLRLFQRSTRKLTLTEGGERFLQQIGGALATLQAAIADVSEEGGQPAGMLKISLAPSFGRSYVVPLLAEFIRRYPGVIPDCHFDNRQVDLVGEGFDVAIGGGIELTPGVVARELGHAHIVATASPDFMRGKAMPTHPSDLAQWDGVARRSAGSGRLRSWILRDGKGGEGVAECRPRAIFDDPEAMAQAAIDGVGVALLPMPHALAHLRSGALLRLLPGWRADSGPLSLYYPSKKLLPAKTRVFVDYLLEQFRQQDFAAQMTPDYSEDDLMTTDYSLFYQYDGDLPARFREVRVFDATVWTAAGAAMTWGEDARTEHASAAAAQAAYDSMCAAALADGYTLARAVTIDPAVFDAPLLHTLLVDATRQAVGHLRAAHPRQQFNAWALLSDDSAMTISLLANSREALATAEDEDEMFWNPGEWQFDEGGAYFDSAYRLLLQAHRDLPFEVEFAQFRDAAFETCIAALELVAAEGLFGTGVEREETLVLFEVSDGEELDGVMERLNSPQMVKRLNDWMASWEE